MVLSPKTHSILHLSTLSILLQFASLILASSTPNPVSNHTNLVYEKCQNQTSPPQNLLSSLLQELVEKSSTSKFHQTNTGDDTIAVSGLFQCRGDLSNHDCHHCVRTAVRKSASCGSSLPARFQLSGCYLRLEPEPEPRVDNRLLMDTRWVRKDYLQHRKCGERHAWAVGEVRDGVFEEVSRCVMERGDGYCERRREGMRAAGQCEGSVEECECGECVSNAFQVAQDECWGSDSGEVYLESCFVTFSYDESYGGRGNSFEGNDVGGGSGKLVAIIVGGGLAITLLFALCYCIRSSGKKQEDW